MHTTVLYRKYRPSSFDEVRGQDHVVKVLEGALKLGNVAHSYLLFGSRGTGKTTIARIIASELGTAPEDTFEIDAASNRGIDDIRELRETVATLPFRSKYKVYIIDEVHMLTKEAWNALLKTLEEPPEHVIFVMATTEIEKVPETIVSRCQVFTFKKPSTTTLKELVLDVAKKEKYKLDPAGAELIALLGDGSFRDTHGMLQKVMSFSKDKTVSLEEIELVAGAPRSAIVRSFLSAIAAGDGNTALEAVRKAAGETIDMNIFLKLVLATLRTLLLARYAPEMKKNIMADLSSDDAAFVDEMLATKSKMLTSRTLEILLEASNHIKYAAVPELALELAVMKILDQ